MQFTIKPIETQWVRICELRYICRMAAYSHTHGCCRSYLLLHLFSSLFFVINCLQTTSVNHIAAFVHTGSHIPPSEQCDSTMTSWRCVGGLINFIRMICMQNESKSEKWPNFTIFLSEEANSFNFIHRCTAVYQVPSLCDPYTDTIVSVST